MKKICILTLGCPKNIADSEEIFKKINKSNSFVWTEVAETADVILLNTCGFIQGAVKETLAYVNSLNILKQRNDNVEIIVYGCAVTRLLNENYPLKTNFPLINHFLPITQKDAILTLLQQNFITHNVANSELPPCSASLHYAYLKISDGCNRKCAFCTIPSIKGRYASIPSADIVASAKQHIADGKREIVLIGQETTNYGSDIGSSLFELVDELSALSGLKWLRIMYAYPSTFDLRLLELMKQRSNICRYIDIPLQHINDTILTAMKRKVNSNDIKRLIENIRGAVPEVRIRSTFITGFPCETKQQHNELLQFLQEMKLDRVGIFKYSKEANTPAASMDKQVKDNEKQWRFDELMQMQQGISLELNKKMVGQKVNVLVEEENEAGYYVGRTEFDAPDIDCDIRIKKTDANPLQIGEITQCIVTSAEHYSLEVEPI